MPAATRVVGTLAYNFASTTEDREPGILIPLHPAPNSAKISILDRVRLVGSTEAIHNPYSRL